jgi:hypothetical protein
MKVRCWNCGHEFNGGVSYDELGWHSYCSECNTSFDVDVIWICVYRDTIEELEDDWQTNLSEILVTMDFANQYYKEYIEPYFEENNMTEKDIEWENASEFWTDYHTADDTEEFYDYASKHNAILDIKHWK